jgi:hypothetical protein
VIEEKPMHKAMQPNPLYTLAIEFLQRHQDEHLTPDRPRLITRCAYHLIDRAQARLDEATDVARQAFGELTAGTCRSYINLDLTTSYALFINGPDGKKRCYPLPEVLRAIRQAEAGAL